MTIERLTNLVLIVGIANVICLALLVVTAFLNVHNYLFLQRLGRMLEPIDGESTTEPPAESPARKRSQRRAPLEHQTTRYDSIDEPDRGQLEWTGPVTPYVPADRLKAGSDSHDYRAS
jgi:hypothetical protein